MWSSFAMNFLLGVSWMIRIEQCGEYNGAVSFLVANHLICIHLRLANLICKYLDNRYKYQGRFWRIVVRSNFTWFLLYVFASLFASFVTHYSSIARAENSPFHTDENCYVDLGRGVSIFTLLLSLFMLLGGIVTFWYLEHKYLTYETTLIFALQALFLIPALSGYTKAYASRDPVDLEWVRVLIVSYNTAALTIPAFPICWLYWRDAKDTLFEWLGMFTSILSKNVYAPLPVYDSFSLSLAETSTGNSAEIELGLRIRDIQLKSIDQLLIPPNDLSDYDELFIASLGRSIVPYCKAAKMMSHISRYLELINKKFLLDYYLVLLTAYNNAPYGMIITKQDHLRRLSMTIYDQLCDEHRTFAPIKTSWTEMIERGGQGSELARLLAAYLLRMIEAVLENARVEIESITARDDAETGQTQSSQSTP